MLQRAMRDGLHTLQNIEADDILAALGLQRRRSALHASNIAPTLAIFAAGAFVGAAAAILLTPKSGEAMRRDLTDGARGLGQRIGQTASGVMQDVRESLPFGNGASMDDDRKNVGAASARRA